MNVNDRLFDTTGLIKNKVSNCRRPSSSSFSFPSFRGWSSIVQNREREKSVWARSCVCLHRSSYRVLSTPLIESGVYVAFFFFLPIHSETKTGTNGR